MKNLAIGAEEPPLRCDGSGKCDDFRRTRHLLCPEFATGPVGPTDPAPRQEIFHRTCAQCSCGPYPTDVHMECGGTDENNPYDM